MPFNRGDDVTFTVLGRGDHRGTIVREIVPGVYEVSSPEFPASSIIRGEDSITLVPPPPTVTTTTTATDTNDMTFVGGVDAYREFENRLHEFVDMYADETAVKPISKPTHPESVKVIDWKESAKLFGNSVRRKMLANPVNNDDGTTYNKGTICRVATYEPNFTCKKDGVVRDTYTLHTLFGTLRFVASEVKEVKKQAQQAKKDRTIRTGVSVRVTNNKHNGLSKELIYKVDKISAKTNKDQFKRSTAVIVEPSGKKHTTLLVNLKRV